MASTLAGIIVAAILLVLGSAPAPAASPGHNGDWAFVRDGRIVSTYPGWGEAPWTASGTIDRDPAWSPDGTELAFSRYEGAEQGAQRFDIFVHEGICYAQHCASGTRQLTSTGANTDPAWSPDGTQIAFTRVTSGQRKIWVMSADGGGARQLTTGPGDDYQPAWSPDGNKIAFTSTRNRLGGASEVWVMNADGSNPTRLTSYWNLYGAGSTGLDMEPAWSPDGTKIVFASEGPNSKDDLWVMSADGSSRKQLTNGPAGFDQPAWSPDGTRIVARYFNVTPGRSNLITMNPSGGDLQQLTDSATHESEPDWRPLTPETAFTSRGHPPTRTSSRTASFRFKGSVAPILSAQGMSFECRSGPHLPGPWPWHACSSPTTFKNLSGGKHTFYVRAKDGSGYHDPTAAKWAWTVLTSLTVSVSGPGQVTSPIFSGYAQIGCGNGDTACTSDFAGGSVTLTATPAAGASFSGWGGACSGTATTCKLSMSQSRNVTATFHGATSPTSLDTNAPCWYAAATKTVWVAPNDHATLRRSGAGGSTIGVNGTPCSDQGHTSSQAYTIASVFNTDTIVVQGAAGEMLTVDQSGGPFAPGATKEPQSTDEIEIRVQAPVQRVLVLGTFGDDHIRVGTGGVNLNADDDVDLALPGSVQSLTVSGGPGNDHLAAIGGLGTGSEAARSVVLIGGAGDDALWGGAGNDRLFGNGGDDALIGRAGDDTLSGGAGDDTLSGGSGKDILRGDDGNDAFYAKDGFADSVNGGAGTDVLKSYDPGLDTVTAIP